MKIKLLRLPQVIEMCGLARSTIWARVKNREFPAPIKLSSRSTAWIERDVQAWIQSKIDASAGK